jgi:hypothetical protein
MCASNHVQDKFLLWVEALDSRHLQQLTPSEVGRALRALSSCYVERRSKLPSGAALGTAGKRAAFALFYAPLHFLLVRAIVRALGAEAVSDVVDLGCGTGAAGAAWALEAGGVQTRGFDRHPWAVSEAAWTYRTLGLPGRSQQADVTRVPLRVRGGSGVMVGYVVNELDAAKRVDFLRVLLDAAGNRARVLVLEPIARRANPWWDEWAEAFKAAGGRADEWRIPATLPQRQAGLAGAAGLDPRELTGRSLYC